MQAGFLNKPPPSQGDVERILRGLVEGDGPPQQKKLDTLVADEISSALLQFGPTSPGICALFLQAAARHLPSLKARPTESAQPAAAASLASTSGIAAALVEQAKASDNDSKVSEVSQVINVVSNLANPRHIISQSGILPVLAEFLPSTTDSPAKIPPHYQQHVFPSLTRVQIDFLEACVNAAQYKFAARRVHGMWPRPGPSSTMDQVLKYYYLRGLVYIGNEDWNLAIRCFKTCLVLPGNSASKISIAAWKHLVLVQCIVNATEISTRCMVLPAATIQAVSLYIQEGSKQLQESSRPLMKFDSSSDNSMHMVEGAPEDIMAAPPARKTKAVDRSEQFYEVGIYCELCKAFEQANLKCFTKLATEHQNVLQSESMAGLVARVLDALHERVVVKASRMFAVAPLSLLSSRLNDMPQKDVRALLLRMSVAHKWNIEIRDENSMVSFPPLPLQNVHVDITELVELTKAVQKMDTAMACSSKYQSTLRKEGKASAGPRGVDEL